MTPAQMKACLEAGIPQAFAEGKTIQKRFDDYIPKWIDLTRLILDSEPSRYRIKPEPPQPKARPFNRREMESLVGCKVKSKSGGIHLVMDCTTVRGIESVFELVRVNGNWYSAEDLRELYTMVDGTACEVVE